MTGEETLRRFAEIAPTEFRKLSDLANLIVEDGRRALPGLIRLWSSDGDSDAAKAEEVLTGMRELAVEPFLSASASAGGESRIRAVAQAGRAYLASSEQVLSKLSRMMESKAPLPAAPQVGPPQEEEELPSRECDEGYLLARKLLNVEDSELVEMLLRQEFLSLEKADRDKEIAGFTKNGKWGRVVDRDETVTR